MMKPTILNVRGTGGSGKSTAVRGLMEAAGIAAEILDATGRRPVGYKLKNGVVVVGRYTNVCGGCDTLSTLDEIVTAVIRYSESAPVVFEGFLWSGLFKSSHELAQRVTGRNRVIFATLNTPLPVCVERVRARRVSVGNLKPFDPRNVERKFRSVIRAHARLQVSGWDTRILPYQNPVPMMEEWLAA